MAHDRSRPNTLILARHLAATGKYEDARAIEAELALKGRALVIKYLNEPALRTEIDMLCAKARSREPKQSSLLVSDKASRGRRGLRNDNSEIGWRQAELEKNLKEIEQLGSALMLPKGGHERLEELRSKNIVLRRELASLRTNTFYS